MRVVGISTKPVFYHDESHSYQVATGHAGEVARITYQKQHPYGQWVEAREWKRLLRPEERFCFGTISRDALAYDVHPPLYYLLLHVVCLAVGTHYWTGTLLNALIDAATVFALYAFARRVTGSRRAAAVAAFVWAVSAASVQVAVVEARQYSLLALVGVLFAHQLLRAVDDDPAPRRWPRLIVLAVLTLAGAMTHHHFAILVAGAFGWCAVTDLRRRPARLLAASAAVAVAYAALLCLHPFFAGTGYKHLSDARLPDAVALQSRVRQALESLAQVVLERRFGSGLPLIVVAPLALIPVAVLLLAWRQVRRGRAEPTAPASRFTIAIAAWLAAVIVGLYLVGVSPGHAMSYRYLAMFWPFLAVAVAIALMTKRSEPRLRAAPTILVCILALACGVFATYSQWTNLQRDPNGPHADALLRGADRVVIDNVGRGHWPRPVWRLREDARVIIAAPNDLLRRPAAWRAGLTPGTLYVSPARSTAAARDKIVASLNTTHRVQFIAHVFGIGDVYSIDTKEDSQQ